MKEPVEHHGQGLKKLLRYVRSTADLEITYGKGEARVVGYSDADHAADKSDRKSTMGQVFMFAGGPITWSSHKQKSVSTSTTEAEYMALSECSKQAIWLKNLFHEIGYVQHLGQAIHKAILKTKDTPQTQLELRGDNRGSLQMVKTKQISDRSKHIDVAYHHIRDLQKSGKIDVGYVPTDEMIADGLTKPLSKVKFDGFLKLLNMTRSKGE